MALVQSLGLESWKKDSNSTKRPWQHKCAHIHMHSQINKNCNLQLDWDQQYRRMYHWGLWLLDLTCVRISRPLDGFQLCSLSFCFLLQGAGGQEYMYKEDQRTIAGVSSVLPLEVPGSISRLVSKCLYPLSRPLTPEQSLGCWKREPSAQYQTVHWVS